MAESIDQLQIDINAQSNRANKVIDTLCSKIDRLTVSMNHLDGSKLGVLANGVQRLGTAMKSMNNVKTADFTRLANNLSNLNKLDVSNISKLSASVNNIGTAFKSLSGVPESVKNITKLTDSISRLSSANVKGLENVDFSKIGNSINLLSNSLSNAPKIQQSIISMTNAVGNLAKSGDKIPLVSSSLGSLGTELNKFISNMSNGANISDSTINFANAIGVLAKSGNTMTKTTSNLSALGVELKKLMKELSTAPKVSQNIIDMTNALAKLARTGSSSGKAANSLVSSFNRISKASSGMKVGLLSAVNGISAIRKSILQAMGIAGGFYAVLQGIKESINIASDLTEVQNVVDVTFGNFKSKIEDLSKVSIPELGMSQLTVKEIGSRFQAMGVAMGISQNGMADMSTELTRLAGDMASFYNVEQKAVGEDLESIFTGQTKPLRQYGLDLTEATLQEWAMKQGIDANINSMSQMEKTMLRYQYVMANTGAAHGDFLRTQNTWANQVRILKENFRELASVIGSSFINALKPLVKALNGAMGSIISFAKVVSNALGKIFGWEYEDTTGGISNDFGDAADGAEDLAKGTGKAADNAKKLKQQLQGIDELNVLNSNNDYGNQGGSGGGGGVGTETDANGGQWVKTDSIFKQYESELDTLYKLGDAIGQKITESLNGIDWEKVYSGAKNFGSGLASFLNGLISPELFGAVGKTIANSLNTGLTFLDTFFDDFDFKDFGKSLATGINKFFKNFDWKLAASTINKAINGLENMISGFLSNLEPKEMFKGLKEFFSNLEPDSVIAIIAFATFSTGLAGKIASSLWGSLSKSIAKKFTLENIKGVIVDAIPSSLGTVGKTVGKVAVTLALAYVAFKAGCYIGKKWYEKATGEEAMGGIKDLIKMKPKLKEIGEAISDGAVVDITITPALRFLSGDDSISTDEVVEAGSKVVENLVGLVKKAMDANVKIQNAKINLVANFVGWDKDKSFKENIAGMVAKFASFILPQPFKWVIDGITAKFSDKDDSKIKGKNINQKAKFTSRIYDGIKDKVINQIAKFTKKDDTGVSGSSISLQAKLFAGNETFNGLKGLTANIQAAFSTGKTSYSFTDQNGKVHTVYKKLGGIFNGTSWKNIPQYEAGGIPSHGTLFWAGEDGSEIVGQAGGRTEVLNESQIASAMYSSVANANAETNQLLRKQNELLQSILEKETGISYKDAFNAVRKGDKEFKAVNGKSAFA